MVWWNCFIYVRLDCQYEVVIFGGNERIVLLSLYYIISVLQKSDVILLLCYVSLMSFSICWDLGQICKFVSCFYEKFLNMGLCGRIYR